MKSFQINLIQWTKSKRKLLGCKNKNIVLLTSNINTEVQESTSIRNTILFVVFMIYNCILSDNIKREIVYNGFVMKMNKFSNIFDER